MAKIAKLSKSPTVNGRPWRECIDQLDPWEVRFFLSVERDYAKPRIQKWAENKWWSLRSKGWWIKSLASELRRKRYTEAIAILLAGLPVRFVKSHDGQYESYMWLDAGPLCVSSSSSNVLDHQDAEVSLTIRDVTYTYRWVYGDEPIRDPGFSKFDRR